MAANDRQVGGDHYAGRTQHWDLVVMYGWDYFQAQIIRYIMRHKDKGGIEDLQKAAHVLEKYIELEGVEIKDSGEIALANARVDQPLPGQDTRT